MKYSTFHLKWEWIGIETSDLGEIQHSFIYSQFLDKYKAVIGNIMVVAINGKNPNK